MSASDYPMVYHSAFGRFSIVRDAVLTNDTCHWCGQNPHGHLFQYGTVKDDDLSGWVNWFKYFYCSIDCFRVDNEG